MSSLRQLRRKAERQQIADNKRRTQELIESRKNLGIAQMLDGMIQQGISKKDLDEAYTRGWNEGHKAGQDAVLTKYETASKPYALVFIAATALALHRHYGFGGKRAGLAIAEALEIVKSETWIDPEDITEMCKNEVGLDVTTMSWE